MARLVYIGIFALIFAGLAALGAQGSNVTNVTSGYTNLNVTQFSVPTVIGAYSPVPISFNITNTGNLAAINVTAELNIYGVAETNRSFDFAGLAPGQHKSVIVYVNNVSQIPGRYIAYLSAGYNVNGTTHYSGRVFSAYSVTSTPLSSGAFGVSLDNLQDVHVLSVPLLFYATPGSVLSQIGVFYGGYSPVNINLGISKSFSNLVSFSASTLYLTKNQSISSGILFKPFLQSYENTYTIPLNITEESAVPGGGPKSIQTSYVQLSVINTTNTMTSVSEQVSMTNDSTSSVGVIQINSPPGYNIYGSELQISLPTSVAGSISNIDAYGSHSQIEEVNGEYVIEWFVGNIQKNQQVYLYYDIAGITDPSAFARQELVFSSTSQINATNIFTSLKTTLPIFYTNSTQQIAINMLYTGPSASNAIISLVSTHGTTIRNSTRIVAVYPNQELEQNFGLITNNYSGTDLLRLNVVVDGVNGTYNLPVVILNAPSSILRSTQDYLLTFKYFILFIVIPVIVVVYIRLKRRKPQKYNADRAGQLIRMREQINRRG